MKLLSVPHPKITTRDESGKENGFLVPIFNVRDSQLAPEQHPQQVYLTVVAPHAAKGPHLHFIRWGLFTCIKGNIKIVVRTEAGYEEYWSGENHEYASIQVPAHVPAMLQNQSDEAAYVLNMPAPSWTPDQHDEHPASFADYLNKPSV